MDIRKVKKLIELLDDSGIAVQRSRDCQRHIGVEAQRALKEGGVGRRRQPQQRLRQPMQQPRLQLLLLPRQLFNFQVVVDSQLDGKGVL